MKFIGGMEAVEAALKKYEHTLVGRVAEALEKGAVLVANDAKKDHERGRGHRKERYENQTTTLTRSITPELIKVTSEEVLAEVFTSLEYAYWVEARYPYLVPALHKNRGRINELVKKAR